MKSSLRAGAIGLALMMFAATGMAAATDITVRVLSRDAKFVGSGMGGARVVLRDAQTGEVLASGLTRGGTGDTAKLMHEDRGRRALMADDDSAAFRTSLDLDQPRLIRAEVAGPGVQQQAGHAASATQWVVPGKHLSAGDGWVIELPGFVVDVLEPPGQGVTLAAGESLTINAQVVMMCGCPVTPEGLWDATGYEVGMLVSRDGRRAVEAAMTHTGKGSLFAGRLPVSGDGVYEITVYAYDARTGNTGLDSTTMLVRSASGGGDSREN